MFTDLRDIIIYLNNKNSFNGQVIQHYSSDGILFELPLHLRNLVRLSINEIREEEDDICPSKCEYRYCRTIELNIVQ